MNRFLCIAVTALVFASCKNGGNREMPNTVTAAPTSFNMPPLIPGASKPASGTNRLAVPVNGSNPAPVVQATSLAELAAKQAAGNSSKAGLNPAHGAPGHRCDIAVGAPLSTAASSTPAPVANPAPVAVANPVVTASPGSAQAPKITTGGTAKAGVNPAHGAPGHRCDIAVGAPLNSPAAAPSTAGTAIPSTISSPAPATVQAVPPLPGNKNAKLNPAHGAPGHDCSIAVGQPLKS